MFQISPFGWSVCSDALPYLVIAYSLAVKEAGVNRTAICRNKAFSTRAVRMCMNSRKRPRQAIRGVLLIGKEVGGRSGDHVRTVQPLRMSVGDVQRGTRPDIPRPSFPRDCPSPTPIARSGRRSPRRPHNHTPRPVPSKGRSRWSASRRQPATSFLPKTGSPPAKS